MRPARPLGRLIRVFMALLVGAGLTLRLEGVPSGLALGHRGSSETVVARVNGDPLTWEALERLRGLHQANRPGLDESQAYEFALETLARHRLLVQEARRRGLDVTAVEVRDHRERLETALRQAPELARILEIQRRAFGADAPAYERDLHEAYREALLLERLYQAWAEEWEPPSEQTVEADRTGRTGQNVLVLIPLPFEEQAAAQAALSQLRAFAEAGDYGALPGAFDRAARQLRHLEPEAFSHQVFIYEHPSELPDFAHHARNLPEGQVGMFERGDGSWVVYLVLKQESVGPVPPIAAGRSDLDIEVWARWMANQERRLWDQAEIDVFPGRMPRAARQAAANLFLAR